MVRFSKHKHNSIYIIPWAVLIAGSIDTHNSSYIAPWVVLIAGVVDMHNSG